ncbi:MAG: S46 family peptidase [Bacteroides sp.]|nr:S46 family peptidase [Bacteroides sp.]
MNKRPVAFFILVVACLYLSVPFCLAQSERGFWLPIQIEGKVYQTLKKEGLRLSPKDIYEVNQTCLSNAILSLSADNSTFTPFATASFISGNGLVLTNYHCVARYLERISDAEHDYVKYGCWATKRQEETYLPNLQINQLISIHDVTESILQGTDSLSGAPRNQRIQANGNQLIKEYAHGPRIEGKVFSLFGGRQYVLTLFRRFNDVRIVAAPPLSVGKFGGDTDNWQWPRYSADFALLRIYANNQNQPANYSKDNQPYHNDAYLPLSTKGIKAGDFVMVGGYPAQTRQYVPSFALEKIIFKDTQAEADIAKIKLDFYNHRKETAADSLRSYYSIQAGSAANIYLKAIGEINGIRESDLISDKRQEEQALAQWIADDADRSQRYGSTLLTDMQANYERLTQLNYADQLFRDIALYGASVIPFAGKFEKLVQIEQQQRKNMHTALEREIQNLKPLTESFYRSFRPADDCELMTRLLDYYLQHVDTAFYAPSLKIAATHHPHQLSAYIDSLYRQSPLNSKQAMLAFLDSVPTQGTAALSNDALYQLSLGFYRMYVDKINRQRQTYQSRNMELYSRYLQAYAEKRQQGPIAFDANRTLRFSTGTVKAAIPSEGVIYTPFSTPDGLLSRHRLYTGNPDFDLPTRFTDLLVQRQYGTYLDRTSPVCCFLTDARTTSGSSGSPVLNAKGEIIGLNFDRIWQGLSSDYETTGNDRSRNIAVDIRYILWTIEQYSHSQYVLEELDIQGKK